MNLVTICSSVVIAGSICTMGCVGPLSETCAKALPVLTEANSLSTDASIALENASEAVDKTTALTPEQRAAVQVQLNNARLALQAASGASTLLSGACQEPDPASIFRDFLTAWAAIRPFLALLGDVGGSTIQDPMVWRLNAGR